MPDLGLEFAVKDLQLKLTGTLSNVRVLPGVPEQVVVSISKSRPSEPLQLSARNALSDQRIAHEIVLSRNYCLSDPKSGCEVLLIRAVDAWGNQIRDLKHYEVVIESSASESKLQTSFNLKGDAVVFLSSGSREDNKVFLADGSAMGIGLCRFCSRKSLQIIKNLRICIRMDERICSTPRSP